jgi:multimeric flavodoxin WrbA
MKITIINGGPRKNGATNKILIKINENIHKENPKAEINHINLIDLHPAYCLGCQSCYKTGKCVIKTDNMEEIHDMLEQSDGIVFGSPTYSCNVSGLFKVFHSRVHMTDEQLLFNKPCVLVTTCEITGMNKTLSLMKERVITAGGYVSGGIGIKIPLNENPIKKETENKIDSITKKFMKDIKKNRKPLFERFYTYIAINLFFKPFVMKNPDHHEYVIRSWKDKGLIK